MRQENLPAIGNSMEQIIMSVGKCECCGRYMAAIQEGHLTPGELATFTLKMVGSNKQYEFQDQALGERWYRRLDNGRLLIRMRRKTSTQN